MIKLLLLLCLFNYKIFSYFIAIPFLVLVMRHPKMIEMFTVFCSVMARIKKMKSWAFFGHKIICLKGILLSLVHVVPECWPTKILWNKQQVAVGQTQVKFHILLWLTITHSLIHTHFDNTICGFASSKKQLSPKNQRKFW